MWVLFLLYCGMLLYLLFLAPTFGREATNVPLSWAIFRENSNLIPFVEISRYFRELARGNVYDFAINVIGNLIVFAPFGFFVPALFKRMRGAWWKVFPFTVFMVIIVSLVEIIQVFTGVGRADIDDVLLNTTGAVLIYLKVRV